MTYFMLKAALNLNQPTNPHYDFTTQHLYTTTMIPSVGPSHESRQNGSMKHQTFFLPPAPGCTIVRIFRCRHNGI